VKGVGYHVIRAGKASIALSSSPLQSQNMHFVSTASNSRCASSTLGSALLCRNHAFGNLGSAFDDQAALGPKLGLPRQCKIVSGWRRAEYKAEHEARRVISLKLQTSCEQRENGGHTKMPSFLEPVDGCAGVVSCSW
jgi:hypothetical protein